MGEISPLFRNRHTSFVSSDGGGSGEPGTCPGTGHIQGSCFYYISETHWIIIHFNLDNGTSEGHTVNAWVHFCVEEQFLKNNYFRKIV